jgi:hypothetical protein
MLNQLKEATAARIMRDLPTEGPVSKSAIEGSDLPDNMKQFFARMLDRHVELAIREAHEAAGRWYEAGSAVAVELMSDLLDTARETARFPEDQWPDAVRRSTDLIVRYAVKPVETILLFAFGVDGESIRSADLRRCVRFFRDHRPVRRGVIHFLDGHPTEPVARDDFDEGLRHFHDRLTAEFSADDWIETLDPLQDLTAFSGLKQNSVPVEGAVILFRHLGLERVADRVGEEAERRGAVFVRRHTLEQLVKSELSIAEAWESVPDENPEEDHTGEAPAAREAGTTPDEDEPAETNANQASDAESEWAPAPGWQAPATDADESTPRAQESGEPVPDASETEDDPEDSPEDSPEDVPLWQQFRASEPASRAEQLERAEAPLWKTYRENEPDSGTNLAEKVAEEAGTRTGGLDHLETRLLGERADKRARFVRVLFKGDSQAYADTLAMLAEAVTWDQASRILSRSVFRKFDVDIYGDAAVEFTDAIERSFDEAA